MLTTDAIADMLTRIRNALRVKHNDVTVPVSKEKKEIARILLEEGYINGYEVVNNGNFQDLLISLKYDKEGRNI